MNALTLARDQLIKPFEGLARKRADGLVQAYPFPEREGDHGPLAGGPPDREIS